MDEPPLEVAHSRPPRRVKRIGHKGADSIRQGNTLESFEAAVAAGAEMIELDVLRPRSEFRDRGGWRRAPAGPVPPGAPPLLVAHDWRDAARRRPQTLDRVLDAFTRPPLDRVAIDCDLKIAGREDEVAAALRARDLMERASISTMEVSSLMVLRELEPDIPLGWTIPRVTRDWNSIPWARPLVGAALVSLRRRLPGIVRRRAPELGVVAIWAYHPLVTPRLVRACADAGLELVAWTVDDLARMRALADLGVDGICTNDPRLFTEL
ncbi:MAG TPA: glycerophosphodiester phosphodiesterase [Solirubrobacterales bacterium]|nr:glycerophosphodiester phosphodiesterase [Solirubrobacterales bacterium]